MNVFPFDAECSRETAENLVLVALDQQSVGVACPIKKRFKDEIDVIAFAGESPTLKINLFAFFIPWDIERDVF